MSKFNSVGVFFFCRKFDKAFWQKKTRIEKFVFVPQNFKNLFLLIFENFLQTFVFQNFFGKKKWKFGGKLLIVLA